MSDPKAPQPEFPEIKLEVSPEVAHGRYTNFAVIGHTPNEFIFDFAVIYPAQPAFVVSRLVTSPRHAKALLRSLEENVRRFEASNGPITELSFAEVMGPQEQN